MATSATRAHRQFCAGGRLRHQRVGHPQALPAFRGIRVAQRRRHRHRLERKPARHPVDQQSE